MQQQKEAQEVPFPENMRDAHIRRAVVTGALGLCYCLSPFVCSSLDPNLPTTQLTNSHAARKCTSRESHKQVNSLGVCPSVWD